LALGRGSASAAAGPGVVAGGVGWEIGGGASDGIDATFPVSACTPGTFGCPVAGACPACGCDAALSVAVSPARNGGAFEFSTYMHQPTKAISITTPTIPARTQNTAGSLDATAAWGRSDCGLVVRPASAASNNGAPTGSTPRRAAQLTQNFAFLRLGCPQAPQMVVM
jgi:hypothetical protein